MSCGPRLLDLVRDLERREPQGLDDTWRDLGLDSLDLLVLVTRAEDEFSLSLSDSTVAGSATVRDLAEAIDGQLRDGARLSAAVSGDRVRAAD